MQKDAEMHSAEDAKKKDMVETKNIAEQMVYTAEKSIRDNGDKVTPEIKAVVNEKIEAVKKIKDGTEREAIMKATTELSTEMQKIGEYMSKNAPEGAPAGDAGADAGATGEEKVRDVNYEEKKEDTETKADTKTDAKTDEQK